MTDIPPPLDPVAEVLAVPGVASLFPVDVVARVRESIPVAGNGGRVAISTAGGFTRLRARIAVDATTPAPQAARAAADALLRSVADADSVTVQIAHID